VFLRPHWHNLNESQLLENIDPFLPGPNVPIRCGEAGRKGHRFFIPDFIQSVHRGQVWANSEQLQYLIEGITQVPSLRMVNAMGIKLLTPREEQVVALVAGGLSNREVAHELSLSEHTIKKYLFRIFDKLGISSRVELVLYAVSHGGSRQAEWIAGAGA
jgi:DNA-binding NarL/FixJ family response regulator